MTDTEIERIEALMREATPGPWHARRNDQDDGRTHYDVDDSDEREVACVRHALPHNARLIVAAINALPALLAERKELLRRAEEAEATVGAVYREIRDYRYMDPPDGGDPTLAEMVKRLWDDMESLRAQLAEMDDRREHAEQCAVRLSNQLAEAQSAQERAVAPHPYLRIDDYRCATCGRRKAVCEAEWAEHTKE